MGMIEVKGLNVIAIDPETKQIVPRFEVGFINGFLYGFADVGDSTKQRVLELRVIENEAS